MRNRVGNNHRRINDFGGCTQLLKQVSPRGAVQRTTGREVACKCALARWLGTRITRNEYHDAKRVDGAPRGGRELQLFTDRVAINAVRQYQRAQRAFWKRSNMFESAVAANFEFGRKLQLHGGGHSRRSFIHMRDVSDATWKIATQAPLGETYHISTNEIVTIRELVELICKKLGVRFEECVEVVGERKGKDAAYMLDSTKLREKLGWKDQVALDTGIDQCIAWVKRHFQDLKQLPYDYQHKP